jgi:hypothetical protein
MRIVILTLLIFLLNTFSAAQTELPDQLKNPVAFTYSDFTHSKFYYGIRKLTGDVKSCQGIYLQTYEIIYEIGYVRGTTSVKKPRIFLGFCGIDFTRISEWEPLKSKPSDTLIQPCVHNLLSDIIETNADLLGIADVLKCDLLVYNLFNDKALYGFLNEKQPMPENCNGIFYLLWDKEMKPTLPAFLSSSQPVKMAISTPVKIPRAKLSFMETPSSDKTTTQATEKKPDKVPENTKVQKGQKAAPKDVSKKKPKPVASPPVKKSNLPAKDPVTKETPDVNPEIIISSPDISPLFLPDIQAFLNRKKIQYNQNDNIVSLSPNNDTLFIKSKSKEKLINSVAIQLKKIPVTCIQDQKNRRGYLPDPESLILNRVNLEKMIFTYKGQQLFLDKQYENVLIPEIISSTGDLRVASEIPVSIITAQGPADTIKIITTYEKLPVKLLLTDTKYNKPVKGCPIRIIIKKKFGKIQVNEEIYSLIIDSGDDIPDLFKNDLIQYTVILDHPDFKPVIQKIYSDDIETLKSIRLENQHSYSLIYVEPAMIMREKIVFSLDKRKETLIRNSPHFFLFISNTDRPLVVIDSSEYTRTVHKISMLYDDKPNPEVDYQSLVDHLTNLDFSGDSIKVNFYMSVNLYRNQGREFINRLVKDVITLIYKKEPEIYIFTDESLPPEEKIDEIKYHYFTLKD